MGRGPTIKYHQSMNEAYVEGTLTCLKPNIIRDRVNTDFPLVLNIEPTNACNLSCVYCPREQTALREGTHHLPLTTFRKIVDEATHYQQLIMLNLHKDGEPLLNKRLPQMVAYAKKRNVAQTIHLNTNGTLLNTPIGRDLLESGIDDVTISVDAAFPETYAKLKRNSDFDSLTRGIESFIDYKNRFGFETTIRVKIMEFQLVSEREIQAFLDKWEGVADEVQVTGVHTWSGAIKGLKVTDEISFRRYPCALLWYALAVNSLGKVSICNVDWDYSGVVGNIYERPLHQIWNDAPIRDVRKAHLNGRWEHVSVCEACAVWVSVGDLKSYFESRTEFLEEKSVNDQARWAANE